MWTLLALRWLCGTNFLFPRPAARLLSCTRPPPRHGSAMSARLCGASKNNPATSAERRALNLVAVGSSPAVSACRQRYAIDKGGRRDAPGWERAWQEAPCMANLKSRVRFGDALCVETEWVTSSSILSETVLVIFISRCQQSLARPVAPRAEPLEILRVGSYSSQYGFLTHLAKLVYNAARASLWLEILPPAFKPGSFG